MAQPWFLGIDMGTGSCKTAAVDIGGRVIGFGQSEYPAENTHQKWQEQNPQSLLTGLIRSVQSAMGSIENPPGPCSAVSIGGALHSLVALDGLGSPLCGVLTWADGRAVTQGESIKNSRMARKLYEQTGCPPHGMYPLYKIMWLRDEQPDLFEKAARFVSAKEYIFQKLTGEYLVDYGLAAGSGLLNIHTFTWDDSALQLAGIKRQHLSELCPPRSVFHRLRSQNCQRDGDQPRHASGHGFFRCRQFKPWGRCGPSLAGHLYGRHQRRPEDHGPKSDPG